MGKIFCVEFRFVNNIHNALVSVYQKGNKQHYHIQLIDGYLKKLFLTEHIRYEGSFGYKELYWYKNNLTLEVINRMVLAIEKELNRTCGITRFLFPRLQKG